MSRIWPLLLISAALIFQSDLVQGGHYLFYLPLCSKSVRLGVMPMVYALLDRHHSVTLVTPFKEKKPIPGLTEIVHESSLQNLLQELSDTIIAGEANEISDIPIGTFYQTGMDNNRAALRHPQLREIINNDKIKVDVVVVMPALANEAGYFLAHKKNASLALAATVPYLLPWMAKAVDSPINPAYMPVAAFTYTQRMTFPQRFTNSIATAAMMLARKFILLPDLRRMLSEEFPDEEIPDIDEMLYETSLVINHGSPFLGDGLRPTMPNVVMAGLMSCTPPGDLDKDLLQFIKGAKHGVIFMSFGSVLKASKMPESKKKLFFSVFGKLKQRVIWKWEEDVSDLPSNIMIKSWLPQTALLAHPNVKLFITHGGAGSFQETICYKTPILGIPMAMDQNANVEMAINFDIGKRLSWHNLTEDLLTSTIEEILTNPEYESAVSQLSDKILDQPLHPLDTAVWWLEYLLRHPHNPGMRSEAHQLYWFQFYLLDVVAVLGGCALLVVYVFVRLVKCCCCRSKVKTD